MELDQLRPAEAERHYLEAMRIAEQHVGSSSVATSLPASLLAQIRSDQGRFDEAEDLIIDRIPIIDATGMLECVLQAYLALVRVARHRGNIGRCHALLEQADNLGQARGWGRLVAAVLLERLRLYCAEGQLCRGERVRRTSRAACRGISRVGHAAPGPTFTTMPHLRRPSGIRPASVSG